MAKRNKVFIDVMVNGKMEKVSVDAAKLGKQLDNVGTSAHTADRRLKGAAQASSGAGKNFSKMSQGMGGLVGIYASFAAQVFALSAAFGFLKRAADLENLRAAQTDFASSSGLAIRGLTADLQKASAGMLNFKDAAQASAIGVAKGFSGAQLEQITVGAVKASKALGNSFDDTFSRLLRGVSKAEPELLDELGITLRLETATESYAQAIGKSRDALTEAERSQAVFVETMRQLNDTFGDVSAKGNPFIELQVTFQKIVEDITAKVLPSVTSLVDIINNNAKVAAGSFAALAGLIILNLTGFGSAVTAVLGGFGKAIGFVGKKTASLSGSVAKKTTSSIGTFIQKKADDLEFAALLLEEKMEKVGSNLQGTAQKAVEGGAQSKTLGKLALGKEVTPQALGRLKKDLARVKKDIESMGETASKAFAGVTVDAIEEMTKEIEEFEKELEGSEKKVPFFRKVALQALKAVQKAAGGTSAAVRGIGKGFDFARKHADKAKKAFRIGGFILTGILVVAKAIDKLAESPLRVIDGFKSFVVSLANLMQRALNVIVAGVNGLLKNSFIEDIVSRFYDTSDGIFSEFTFADGLMDKLDGLESKMLKALGTDREQLGIIQGQFDFVKGIVAQEEKRVQLAKDLVEEYRTLAKDFGDIFSGKAGQGDFQAQMTAIGSGDLLGARTALTQFDDLLAQNAGAQATLADAFAGGNITEEQFNRAYERLFDSRLALQTAQGQAEDLYRKVLKSPEFQQLPQVFRDALESGSDELVGGYQSAALAYGAELASLESSGRNLRNTLGSGDPMQMQIGLEQLLSTYENLQGIEAKFGKDDSRNESLMVQLLGENWRELQPQLAAVASELDYLRQQKNDLLVKEERMRGLPSGVRDEMQLDLTIERANIALSEKEALLKQMGLRTQFQNEAEERLHEQTMERTRQEITLLEEKLKTAERNQDVATRLADTAMQSLENGMASAINSIVQGTATVKEAFSSLAMSVLQALSQMISKMIAVRIMQSLIGMPGGSDAGMTDMSGLNQFDGMGMMTQGVARYGGVFGSNGKSMPGYATGGIAKGPQAGYPVMMHGTEAVVPLPNGKSIPVHLEGGAGQQNNVTVNVAIDNNGQATQDAPTGEHQSMNIGRAVASAVQKELQNQKRAGGILNPYGAA